MDILITNVSYAIIRQLGIDEVKLDEIKEIIKQEIKASPLFNFEFEYKNPLEVSLDFDIFLRECLNDVILQIT